MTKLRYFQDNDLPSPAYATDGAAGFDIRADVPEEGVVVKEYEVADIPTGLYFDIPAGWELQIRPRSGISKHLCIRNAPGTVDSDYKGQVFIRCSAWPCTTYHIQRGERIAQAVLAPVFRAILVRDENPILVNTERGTGGFGSTGKS